MDKGPGVSRLMLAPRDNSSCADPSAPVLEQYARRRFLEWMASREAKPALRNNVFCLARKDSEWGIKHGKMHGFVHLRKPLI